MQLLLYLTTLLAPGLANAAQPPDDVDSAWESRNLSSLQRLCHSPRQREAPRACYLAARTQKEQLESLLASVGADWTLDEASTPLPESTWALASQVAAAYRSMGETFPRSNLADDALAMSAGLRLRMGLAEPAWQDALRAAEVGNGDIMGQRRLADFALHLGVARVPRSGIWPDSSLPLLRATPQAVDVVHTLLDQAGLSPSWRNKTLARVERMEPADARSLLEEYRFLLRTSEVEQLVPRALAGTTKSPPRAQDLALYRRRYAEARAGGASPARCEIPFAGSAACLSEASVDLYFAIAEGKRQEALALVSMLRRHRWSGKLGLDLESTHTVLLDMARAEDPRAAEKEIRRLAASVDARRLMSASGGYLPYDLDPTGLSVRLLDAALGAARPQVLQAMLAGEFATFSEFLASDLGQRLAGGLDADRRSATQLRLDPTLRPRGPAEEAHWKLIFDAIRTEGLASSRSNPTQYERHIRAQIPGLLGGNLPTIAGELAAATERRLGPGR